MNLDHEKILRKKHRQKKLAKRSYSEKSGSLARQVVKVKIARGYAGSKNVLVSVKMSK